MDLQDTHEYHFFFPVDIYILWCFQWFFIMGNSFRGNYTMGPSWRRSSFIWYHHWRKIIWSRVKGDEDNSWVKEIVQSTVEKTKIRKKLVKKIRELKFKEKIEKIKMSLSKIGFYLKNLSEAPKVSKI